jgi:hypothetical protein
VANLTVSHLASWQADGLSASAKRCVWMLSAELTPIRHGGGSNRIAWTSATHAKPINDH